MARFTSYHWAGAVVTAIGLFATAVVAQPPRPAPADPTELAKARQRIADQKAEADVLEAIKFADGIARSSPARAVDALKKAQVNTVDQSVSISGDARKQLTALIQGRISLYGGKPAGNPNPGIVLDPKGTEVKAGQKELLAKQSAEHKDVLAGIKSVEAFNASGNTAKANAEIARLTNAYPYNPSVLALGQKESMQDRLATAQAYYAESRRRWVENQMQINKSSLPAISDVEFPADWKEKSERRLKAIQVQLSASEKKIIEALDKPISINFNERPLDEALQDLSNTFGVPLHIEKKSLEDLGLDLKRGVSLQGKGLSGRTVLRSVLATQGLTFVVKDEAIQIVTVERSKTLLTTRVYYVGDLVKGVGPFSGLQWGPFINDQQSAANLSAIIDAVRKIDPLSWNGPDTGGPGSVTYHAASQSLIVRNSAEVHFSLGKAIYGGK
jgi:hypothetical protein